MRRSTAPSPRLWSAGQSRVAHAWGASLARGAVHTATRLMPRTRAFESAAATKAGCLGSRRTSTWRRPLASVNAKPARPRALTLARSRWRASSTSPARLPSARWRPRARAGLHQPRQIGQPPELSRHRSSSAPPEARVPTMRVGIGNRGWWRASLRRRRPGQGKCAFSQRRLFQWMGRSNRGGSPGSNDAAKAAT